LTRFDLESVSHDGVHEEKKEGSRVLLPENLTSFFSTLFPSTPNPSSNPAASHNHLAMAGEGNPKPVAIAPTAASPAIPSPSNAPNPAADTMMEDEAIFVQPLAMVPATGRPVGATHWSADHPGRPTKGRDTQRPRSAARSPSPIKRGRSGAHAQSPYKRPPKEIPPSWKPIAKQLFNEDVATRSSVPPQEILASPAPQKNCPVSGQGATPIQTPDAQ